MPNSIVQEACQHVERLLENDPTAALNEGEFQALLQVALLDLLPDRCEATLGEGVIARLHHPSLTVPRVYRELKPEGGRGGKEVDIAILQNRPQVVEGKLNGAPAKFAPPYAVIIETKIDASATAMLMGKRARPRTADLLNDIEKWAAYRSSGTVQAVAAVVLTAEPEAYEGLENVFAVRRLPPKRGVLSAADPVDPWPFIDVALAEVAEEYRCHPVGCLREKDFESRVLAKLRAARLPRADYSLPDGSCVSIDPVRAQWSGPWAEHLGQGRRHDIVVLHPSGRSLLAELELKTSHSDSHNWFRKREVEGELHAMQSLVQQGLLARARFVMFRYGQPLWEADAETLFKKYPDVEFDYIAV